MGISVKVGLERERERKLKRNLVVVEGEEPLLHIGSRRFLFVERTTGCMGGRTPKKTRRGCGCGGGGGGGGVCSVVRGEHGNHME